MVIPPSEIMYSERSGKSSKTNFLSTISAKDSDSGTRVSITTIQEIFKLPLADFVSSVSFSIIIS